MLAAVVVCATSLLTTAGVWGKDIGSPSIASASMVTSHAYDSPSSSTIPIVNVAPASTIVIARPMTAAGTGASALRRFVAAEDVLPTSEVENSKLQNIVNDLYKGTTNPNAVGNGATADAVRAEAETGEPTGGVFHTMKAEQYSTALNKLLQSGTLNSSDQLVAQSLLDDLQSALGNRP
jgi:filamentous hemagglutinin